MRQGHLEETLRRIIAEALAEDVKDPRIGFVTISEVRVNRDRTVAQVFYTCLGEEEEKAKSFQGLVSSARYLRGVIGDTLRIRTIPELRFKYDDSLDRSFRLDEVMDGFEPSSGEGNDDPDRDAPEESS